MTESYTNRIYRMIAEVSSKIRKDDDPQAILGQLLDDLDVLAKDINDAPPPAYLTERDVSVSMNLGTVEAGSTVIGYQGR